MVNRTSRITKVPASGYVRLSEEFILSVAAGCKDA